MNFNLLDFLSLGYIAASIHRGRRTGLAAELPGLVSVITAIVAGGGLFHWSEKLVTGTAEMAGQTRGLTTFLGVLIATFFLWRHFKARIRQWTSRLFPDEQIQRRGGMAVGGLRALGLCALVFLLGSTVPIGEFRKPFTRGSLLGRVVMKTLRPAYARAHPK